MRRALLIVALLAFLAPPALAAGSPPSWPAPKDPMTRTKAAGLTPERFEHLRYHVHSHLDVFVDGKRLTVPAGIGIDTKDPAVQHGGMPDGSVGYGGITRCPKACISPLHTHADYGLIHTETTKPTPNTLGEFFVEWGVRLDRRCVGTFCSDVKVYVNGKRFTGDPRTILLANHTEIAIVIGTPPTTIPSKFPTNVPV